MSGYGFAKKGVGEEYERVAKFLGVRDQGRLYGKVLKFLDV